MDIFLPLSDEELKFLTQSFTSSGGGPESIPQMPSVPKMPDFESFETESSIENSFETGSEQHEQQEQPQQSQQPAPTQPATQPTPPVPTAIVNVSDYFGQGRSLVSQTTLDDAFQRFEKGKLKSQAKLGPSSVEWLKQLLLKEFKRKLLEPDSSE